jgi:succinate dehydrogenase hydrophobic anchor subunit
MKSKTKRNGERRSGGWLLALVAALFVVLLLIRMLAFVAGHGRHHF